MKYIYTFGDNNCIGGSSYADLLGGKGANLAEMSNIGIPVPPGFTITTDACNYFMKNSYLPDNLNVDHAMHHIEKIMDKQFGDVKNPLLVSIRSGAKVSMPGMMETVLNVGLTKDTVIGLATISSNPRFAYDSYRRLIMMYADVVMQENQKHNIRHTLESFMGSYKKDREYLSDTDLNHDDLQFLCSEFKNIIYTKLGTHFPDDPQVQLNNAIEAVFKSWNGERARQYRKIENITDNAGTAVNIQGMVFGNMGPGSATGVAFTRNPSTGSNHFYGEWLENAQGEDVVAGIRTPYPLNENSKSIQSNELITLEEKFPKLYKQLNNIKNSLESHYKDMQDIEFTIENERLWMLQTRTGKRTGSAAIKIAFDLIESGMIDEKEALKRISAKQINEIMLPSLDIQKEQDEPIIARGLPAGPGGASGQIVFSADDAESWHAKNKNVILVRSETSPEDIHGMYAAKGILTSRGGMTSHAALVARGWGKCCVVGCIDLIIDLENKSLEINGEKFKEGDWLSLNGTSGNVYGKNLPLITNDIKENPLFEKIMGLSKKYQKLGVRANADTKKDAKIARNLGAKGIGLCRTEHMFFNPDRILSMRKMILASNVDERQSALDELLPHQQEDFYGILKAMAPYPVTIRLLDPPLHEFLPRTDLQIETMANELNVEKNRVNQIIDDLHETNPMLGHRGCRLAITYPEITRMQARAIFSASKALIDEGINPCPEIMIPLIGTSEEFINQRDIIVSVFAEMDLKLDYKIGTMIEIPRACLIAGEIAKSADFFSFGTNDLTQTTFGYSRDDLGGFIYDYLDNNILPNDPFKSIDVKGVGQLVNMATKAGRNQNPNLKIGICGEHGGDPSSIKFFNDCKLDYVSCSPFRVPIARLSSAQANKK